MNYNDIVTVEFGASETKNAAEALRAAAEHHRDADRDAMAAEKDDYAAALEASYKAFGHFKGRMTAADATAMGNGISRRHSAAGDPLAAARARDKCRDARKEESE